MDATTSLCGANKIRAPPPTDCQACNLHVLIGNDSAADLFVAVALSLVRTRPANKLLPWRVTAL